MHIGIAGTGRMGTAIGLRLLEAGHMLTVWNRSIDKTKPLAEAGATVAGTAAEVAEASDYLLTILTDAAAIDAVYCGPSGFLGKATAGKLCIEMSTVRPETEIALAEAARSNGAGFVDCPVVGTVGPAREGRLIGLMGGDEPDVARARAVLEPLCRRLEHVGPVGAGASMKLALHLPAVVYWQVLGEALSLCRDVRLAPERIVELFAESSGGTNGLKSRMATIAAGLGGAESGAAASDVDLGCKDLASILAEAARRGAQLPLAERALACFEEASRDGWGGRDMWRIALYWSERSGGAGER